MSKMMMMMIRKKKQEVDMHHKVRQREVEEDIVLNMQLLMNIYREKQRRW